MVNQGLSRYDSVTALTSSQIDEEIEGSKQVGNRPEPIKGPPQAPSTT
jgi:hypothetical protein